MKKIYILISAIAALALTSACNLKTDFPQLSGDDTISLDLLFSEPGLKSAGEGKENVINSVDYFFYTDTLQNPVVSVRDDDPASKISDNKYTISVKAGEAISEDVTVPKLSELFNDGKFYIYAVFNAPEQITAAPLTDVKQTAVALSFAHQEGDDWVVTEDEDGDHTKYFVMTGQKQVNKAEGGNYANDVTNNANVVEMKRLAAKVSAKIRILSSKSLDDGTTWEPMTGSSNIRLYMCNFVQNTLLGAASEEPVLPSDYDQADYKVYSLDTDEPEIDGDYYVVDSQQDFYTYPIEWTAGADNEPYLKLIIPWKEHDGTVPNKELYYKIMFPSDITSIEANKFYQLEVTVDLLGNEGEPVITINGYRVQVVGWKANNKVSSAVSDARYLSVEKESVEYFTETSGISFAASDNVYLVINNVYQRNLSTGNNEYVVQNGQRTNQRTDLGTKAWIEEDGRVVGLSLTNSGKTTNWIALSNENHYLQVGHQLDANLTSDHMDVTPWVYEITMKLVGVDGTSYDRNVVFEQWPNVYVIEDKNSNYVGPNSTQNNTNYGYVWVNNSRSQYGEVIGLGGSNKNPYMYVLTVAVSDTYRIGDPRSRTEDNNLGSTSNTWSANNRPRTWATSTGRLLHYHEADRSADYKNMIAPKIRIASSYGVTDPVGENDARKRCASYQEDGIPAGRWRLPTLAEVKFISSLSVRGRIPMLFGSSSGTTRYWTASGRVAVNNQNKTAEETTDTGSTYVRCVYDEWFWGDATASRPVNRSTFTWGDRPYTY